MREAGRSVRCVYIHCVCLHTEERSLSSAQNIRNAGVSKKFRSLRLLFNWPPLRLPSRLLFLSLSSYFGPHGFQITFVGDAHELIIISSPPLSLSLHVPLSCAHPVAHNTHHPELALTRLEFLNVSSPLSFLRAVFT